MLQTLRNAVIVSTLADLPASYRFLIGTHDGTFHCDESLAVGLLKLLPQYANEDTVIVRSRNPEILKVYVGFPH